MSEFASAAMVRLLAHGMRGIGLDPGPMPPAGADARIDPSLKRRLVESAVDQGGLTCLPLLGQGLHCLAHEPTHAALTGARSALDLLERWQRLERYIHSSHRCTLQGSGPGWAQLQHVARAGAAPPMPAEDLVVLGVLAALLESIGLDNVTVRLGRLPAYPHADASRLARAAAAGATAHWHFAWRGAVLQPGVPHRPDHRRRRSSRDQPGGDARHWPAMLGADPAWPDLAQHLHQRLMADLMHPPTLPRAAADLGLPARTLQRALGRCGLGYAPLLANARCSAAAWQLQHTDQPLAEIGFLCGFADQPHFTRTLQRRLGMTPSAYRLAFGTPTGTAPPRTATAQISGR